MADPFTMKARLCDDAGMVSHEPVAYPDVLRPEWTYLTQLNHLRLRGGLGAYTGEPFVCTGSAHLAGEHIECANPRHTLLVTTTFEPRMYASIEYPADNDAQPNPKAVLSFYCDGRIYHFGRLIGSDEEVVEGMRHFVRSAQR